MVINREFFFRGWLPAGLVINARLLSQPTEGNMPVMVPILNPYPGRGWSNEQPSPIFPVTQATDSKAILLRDPLPEATLAFLPLRQWFGVGTPYILAINTWYEGRIQEVSGADVMAVRIKVGSNRTHYSYYSGLDAKDVALNTMPVKFLRGVNTSNALFIDMEMQAQEELGMWPTVDMGGEPVPARVMDTLAVTSAHTAGMAECFAELSPANPLRYVQCKGVGGNLGLFSEYKYFGIGSNPTPDVQSFFSITYYAVGPKLTGPDLDKDGIKAVISYPSRTDDQLIHFN